jgi:aspartyl-tRNA(Asn)/glutamyl-tRNA(Gln) amidotransferase subunit B
VENKYYLTVGLEIHAELKTKTKMFCSCKNDPDEERPNVNICPVCMAHPGALPVANKEAVRQVMRVGLAVNGTIADFTEFDRKNYFYPDIPKGYQISQYKYPIVSGGNLAGIAITRIHLEEDTGNSKHDRGDYSLVDFNRAGVPLMELVTEPVIHDAKTAGLFAKEYQLLLRYLGASEANMEKGEMRVEANISVSTDPNKFGTKVEVKNLNSFKSVERAIEYEYTRMTTLLEAGKGSEIVQETRGWDEGKQKTFSQRSKEDAQDYRYFPDPDLPKMKLHELFSLDELRKGLPELPWQRRERYVSTYGIKAEDAEMYISDVELGAFFEGVISDFHDDKKLVQLASNYTTSDLAGLRKITPTLVLPAHTAFAKLVSMTAKGDLTSRATKDILAILVKDGGDPETIAKEHNLLAVHDEGAIKAVAEKVIAENPQIVADFKAGKEPALMSLVGRVIKETKGSANPQLTQKLLRELLS